MVKFSVYLNRLVFVTFAMIYILGIFTYIFYGSNNSFGAKFQTTFDGSYEPSHLDLCCLQRPIMIVCGSERVKSLCLFFTCASRVPYSHFLLWDSHFKSQRVPGIKSCSGKFCNGCIDFLVGLTLYSPSKSWEA